MRKIYLVPNLVTTGNLFCGFLSIVSSCRGEFETAAWALFVAAIFDALDGRIARMARATSPFGIEYDSLSDLTSFGIAPGILLHQFSFQTLGRLGLVLGFLFALCSALRLARFNVTASVLSKKFFQGLPTPMAANMAAFSVIFVLFQGLDVESQQWWLVALALALSTLMVSSVPFPSFKEFHWRSRGTVGVLFLGLLFLVLILIRPEVTLFAFGALYIVLSLTWNILVKFRIFSPPEAAITAPGEVHER